MKRITNNISIMLSIIKIAIIVFMVIIICIDLPEYHLGLKFTFNSNFNLYSTIFILCIMLSIYIASLITNSNLEQSTNVFKRSWLLETLFFTMVISIPIFMSTSYESEYKYLFLLLILSSVIQYGSRYGIITSFFCSFFVLTADLLYAPTANGINIYFQRDLILVGVFIFISWVLGYYVDIEAEKNKNKDTQLNLLSHKLKEQNIKREDMESSLLKNEVCFNMLFENSVNSIIVHEGDMIIYANESAAKLLGYSNPLEMNNQLLYKHYSKKDIMSLKKKYFAITDKKLSKVTSEENILDRQGNSISVRNTSSFFVYDGRPAVMTLLFDLTPEKQMETLKNTAEKNLKLLNETREFNSLITDFFVNMSHELKTPINVIYVAVQTMAIYLNKSNDENTQKCRSYLKTMHQNCLRLIRLINNLLDITRLDSGALKINRQNDNIVSVVEDITQSVSSYIKSKDIELIFDTNTEEKIMAFDHNKLERIILNLLSNAFKYTDSKGHIFVNVEDKGESVLITVEDDGKGIPEDKLGVIFQRFGQANRSLSRDCEGSGIGLYLVKSLVELHNGKISVTSTQGKGSKFFIELPAELVDEKYDQKNESFKTNVESINIEFSDIYSLER